MKSNNEGWVYIIRPRNMPYKIGISTDVNARIRDFRGAFPYEVDLIHIVRTSDLANAEAFFHHHFAAKRLNGEWFDLSGEDVVWIKSFKEWNGSFIPIKTQRSVRLPAPDDERLRRLAQLWGCSIAAAIRRLIREEAERRGVQAGGVE